MAAMEGTTFRNPVPIDFATFTFSGQSTASLPTSYISQVTAAYPDQETIRLYVLLSSDTTTPITSSTFFTFADNNSPITTVTAKGYDLVKAQRIQRDVTRAECRGGQAIGLVCYSKALDAMIMKGVLYKPNCPCTC